MQSLNRKMARGVAWMGLLRICVRGIGLVSTVILARLLVPADFGIIAMATSILAFLELATAFSFDVALIQKQDADRSDFDSAWTLNLIFYSVLTMVLVFLAGPASEFYQEPRLTNVIYVLAISFFIRGFENIGVVLFRKDLDFRNDFILMLSKKLVGFSIMMPLAFILKSYWALVFGMMFSSIFGVLLTYYLHPYRPRLSFNATRELMQFSKWLMGNNVVNFLRSRSPDFVIGRISGTGSLGLFSVAFQIATLPSTELVAPMNRVLLPGYSKMAGNTPRLRQSYLDALALVATIAIPAAFGLASVAAPLVSVFLGAKWLEAIPLVSVLAIYGGINAIQTNTGSVFNAIGKPYLITLVGVINMVILLSSSIVLAYRSGPVGVAYAYLGSTIVMAPIVFYMLCREIQLPGSELLGAIWRPIFCSLAMGLVILYLDSRLSTDYELSSFVELGILVPIGALVYTLLVFLLWYARGRPETAEYRVAVAISRKFKRNRA